MNRISIFLVMEIIVSICRISDLSLIKYLPSHLFFDFLVHYDYLHNLFGSFCLNQSEPKIMVARNLNLNLRYDNFLVFFVCHHSRFVDAVSASCEPSEEM